MFLREEASRKPHGVCFLEEKRARKHKLEANRTVPERKVCFLEKKRAENHMACVFQRKGKQENPQQADSIQRNSLQIKSQTKIANKKHKQKIPHFIHSHLEAKENRWYNLKDCMKTKPRQLKKSFSDTGSAIKTIKQKVAFSVVSESDCRKKYFKENLLCTRSLRWNLPEEPCVSM